LARLSVRRAKPQVERPETPVDFYRVFVLRFRVFLLEHPSLASRVPTRISVRTRIGYIVGTYCTIDSYRFLKHEGSGKARRLLRDFSTSVPEPPVTGTLEFYILRFSMISTNPPTNCYIVKTQHVLVWRGYCFSNMLCSAYSKDVRNAGFQSIASGRLQEDTKVSFTYFSIS
jgi:hypothetical protein